MISLRPHVPVARIPTAFQSLPGGACTTLTMASVALAHTTELPQVTGRANLVIPAAIQRPTLRTTSTCKCLNDFCARIAPGQMKICMSVLVCDSYSMVWRNDSVQWLLDGDVYYTTNRSEAVIPSRPFYFILQVALILNPAYHTKFDPTRYPGRLYVCFLYHT